MARYIAHGRGFTFTYKGKKICVPGYLITVPEIYMNDLDAKMYEGFLNCSRHQITEDLTEVLLKGWRDGVKWYLRYWAKMYYNMYPELYEKDTGELRGFDPTKLVAYYWPGEKPDGTAKMYIRKVLTEWGTTRKVLDSTADGSI